MRNIIKSIIYTSCVLLFFAKSIQATNQSNISCGPLVLKSDLRDEFRPDGNHAPFINLINLYVLAIYL